MKKLICFAVVLFTFVLCGSAFASDWNSSMGTFGTTSWDGGSAPSWIQGWLNSNGYSGINASTDYVISETPFFWTGNGYPTNFTIQMEVAGYKDQNTVGFYQGANYAKTQIFAGPDSPYLTKLENITGPFGLYINTPEGNTFYSDRFLNSQQTGVVNAPQVLIYTLKNNTKWLVGFEDLNWASGDRDFNDHVLTMTSTVVPEPISATLFIFGGAGLALARRKNRS